MDQIKALLSDIQTWFQRLTARERRLVIIAGASASVLVLFFILASFANSAAGYRRRTDEKLIKLRDVQSLAASFRESEQSRQAMERQLTSSKLSLNTYLEEQGTAAGLRIPVMTTKPEVPIGDGQIIESAVELTLTDITVNRLVDFVSAVERGPGVVKVKRLRVEPHAANETLTAWATIATYRMKQ